MTDPVSSEQTSNSATFLQITKECAQSAGPLYAVQNEFILIFMRSRNLAGKGIFKSE